MTSYRVTFRCNDDRGNFTGRVSDIHVGREIMLSGSSRTLRFLSDGVKVGRYIYTCSDYSVWTGNLFWDSVSMSRASARCLVEDLLAAGWMVEAYAEDGPFSDLVRSEP